MYRGAYGGRGSGKTRTFAKMSAVWGMRWAKKGISGVIACGRQFMNSLDDSSFAEVKLAIQSETWLEEFYDVGQNYIRSKDGRVEFVFVGLQRNIQSLKSKARILLLWIDEAEAITEDVWVVIDPTIREPGAEVWVTWNPARNSHREKDGSVTGSPTDWRFRKAPPPGAKIAEVNWRDNPWFPTLLEFKRQQDQRERPEQYEHIWEGAYVTAQAGAYYATGLAEAKKQGRITVITPDPLLTTRAYIDIGGTGQNADSFAMVMCQFVGTSVRILHGYEAVGQQFVDHLHWLKEHDYGPPVGAAIRLPHDAVQHEKVSRMTYETAFKDAGYKDVVAIMDSGKGIARVRIEAMRRLFPSIWFNEETTAGLRTALGWYHEHVDLNRSVGLGPLHDWSSHYADAAGLMAIDYKPPRQIMPDNTFQSDLARTII